MDGTNRPQTDATASATFIARRGTNETHASSTDPEAQLYRKGRGKEAKLAYIGHLLMENRNGLVVDARLTQANGTAEVAAALAMLGDRPGSGRITVGADKAYDTAGFVSGARAINVTPHVAQNITEYRGSNLDARTTRHVGYGISQIIRKRIEEPNGWIKSIGGMARAPFSGLLRMGAAFRLRAAAYDLVRLPGLLATG